MRRRPRASSSPPASAPQGAESGGWHAASSCFWAPRRPRRGAPPLAAGIRPPLPPRATPCAAPGPPAGRPRRTCVRVTVPEQVSVDRLDAGPIPRIVPPLAACGAPSRSYQMPGRPHNIWRVVRVHAAAGVGGCLPLPIAMLATRGELSRKQANKGQPLQRPPSVVYGQPAPRAPPTPLLVVTGSSSRPF
jgi:hypothetical protein